MKTLALVIGLAACGGTQPPVPVAGSAPDLAALVGAWSGSYASAATGRSGSIQFTLASGGDSAFGTVVMIPSGGRSPLQPWRDPNQTHAQQGTTSQLLTIRFVQIQGGRVSGALEPYQDPETGGSLYTTFEGRLVGDTIAGTFTTRVPPSPAAGIPTGEWRVVREPPH